MDLLVLLSVISIIVKCVMFFIMLKMINDLRKEL